MADNRNLEQQSTSTHIDTDGGAAVGGNVDVGGDFIGRDQRDHSDDVTGGKFHAQQQTIHIYNTPVGSTVAPMPPEPTPPTPPALLTVSNPYRGLEPFEAKHAANYFGRAAMVAKVLDKLQATNFVAVVGPSGSGKSSLVRAGLVTALHAGKLPSSREWAVTIIRPGDDPLRALATPLVTQIGPALQPVERLKQVRAMAAGLQDGTLPIGDVLAEVRTLHPGLPRLLLIFDQFEETFTLCSDEMLRRTFLQTLLAAASTPWLTVMFTLRADFYGRVLADEPLGKRVDAGLVNVLPMTAEERRAAIEQPAHNAGRRFEEGLVQTILDDIEAEPGELPLLQFALTELWERQTADGVLTHAAYHDIGGVSGAIAKRADQTLKNLRDDEQAAVRRIFTRLVRVAQPDEGAEDTKRRITLAEVDPVMQALVYKLADARLLVTGRDEQSGSETVEVAHEALIRGWAELKVWLNSDREFLLWRQRLRSLVANWLASKADEGALLRGALLTEAEPWLKTRTNDLSEQEQHFITASRALADREVQEREAARQRELDLERRRAEAERQRAEVQLQATQQLRRRAIWLGIALFVAVVVAGVALYFFDAAEKARETAIANEARANERLAQLRGEELLKEARAYKAEGKIAEAIAKLEEADQAEFRPDFDLETEKEDVYRQAAILLVKAGEELARNGDLAGAAKKYQEALDLQPPLDTPVYVRVPAGEFTMGSTGDQIDAVTEVCKSLDSRCLRSWFEDEAVGDDEDQHEVTIGEFWLLRTEVTNWQYGECVQAGVCEAPDNNRWNKPQLRYWPVTDVSWHQANAYAKWRGGRLPTEAEWEKACRGTDARIYPWGNEPPTRELANFNFNEGTMTDVGSYARGHSPYDLLDMAGNVWEWTSSQFQEYPYEADDGREEPTGDATRTLRGGAFGYFEYFVSCAYRLDSIPSLRLDFVGFRVLSPGF
ncbi:MAG: SUMF1/EgtB/PvdO family nonheme iron enzyme [Caldilineaceae bacterium]